MSGVGFEEMLNDLKTQGGDLTTWYAQARKMALTTEDLRRVHETARRVCWNILDAAQVDDAGGCPLCRQ